jgi:hypothetical protein
MFSTIQMLKKSLVPSLLLATALTSPSMAQDAKLSVRATPSVVTTGQSASVDVLAHFPTSAYAFASAQFNVLSTHPAWTFSTGGVVAGNDVFNIFTTQNHMPQQGVFANPSNPFRVWRGTFTPTSNEPALVEVSADPQSISIFPSRLTSSPAPCNPEGGSEFIFVNPVRAGSWLAAPARGTSVGVSDDVIVDGRLITAENFDAILIGLLLPAVQNGRGSESTSTRVEFDGVPDSYTTSVQVLDGSGVPMETLAVNYTKIVYLNTPMHGLSTNAPAGVSSAYGLYRGGVRVATGDLDTSVPSGGLPSLLLPSIPPSQAMRLGVQRRLLVGSETGIWTLSYDQPVTALIRGRSGRFQPVLLDRIEVAIPFKAAANRMRQGNNIRQLSLGAHVFEASGVESIQITPTQPR